MLTIVIANPIQFTIVSAVPLSLEGAFWATIVENNGESAITTIHQNNKKEINKTSCCVKNIKGDITQQTQDKKSALKAIFWGLNFSAK